MSARRSAGDAGRVQRDRAEDLQRLQELWHPDVEFHWPSSLPYGGVSHGPGGERPNWTQTWIPLQPTEAERRRDPTGRGRNGRGGRGSLAATGAESDGRSLRRPRPGSVSGSRRKLARAQMFYFDTTALAGFLAYATDQAGGIELNGHERPTAKSAVKR